MGEAVTTLAASGVLQRFPDLRVISVEGQIGWPHSRKLTDEWFTYISDTDRRLILADNCNQLFGL